MTKKIIALLLALAMVFTLAACGVEANQEYSAFSKKISALGTVGSNNTGVNFQSSIMSNGSSKNSFETGAVAYTYLVVNNSKVVDNYQSYLEDKSNGAKLYEIFELEDYTNFAGQIETFLGSLSSYLPALKTLLSGLVSSIDDITGKIEKINVSVYSDNSDITKASDAMVIIEYKITTSSSFVVIVPSAKNASTAIAAIIDNFKNRD